MGKTAAQVLIEEGIERGIKQGIEQGIIQSKREVLLELMKAKFDSVPQPVKDARCQASECDEMEIR